MKKVILAIAVLVAVFTQPISAESTFNPTKNGFTISAMAGPSIGSDPGVIGGYYQVSPEEFNYWTVKADVGYKYFVYRHFFVEPQAGLFSTIYTGSDAPKYFGLNLNGLVGFNVSHVDFQTGVVGDIAFNKQGCASYRGASWRFGVRYNINRISLKAAFDLRLNRYVKNDVTYETTEVPDFCGTIGLYKSADIKNCLMFGIGYNF
jgi:hypothetical protein